MKKILLITFMLICGLNLPVYALVKGNELRVKDKDVIINWIKDSEYISYFEIERKMANSSTWLIVERLYAEDKEEFTFNDNNLPGQKYYFRIKSVFKNDTYSYSEEMEAELNNPSGFSLDQNYPNPFNPETTIKYTIPSAGHVDLRIYNLLGQELHTLVSEYKDAGDYTVNFSANDLNSGVYIYSLVSGENVFTRKMTFLK
jgi:hypothetical protein